MSALEAASSVVRQGLKWIIVVDDDIDITDIDSVLWAMAWRPTAIAPIPTDSAAPASSSTPP
jgi:UbiD family decarboxylase